MVGVEYLVSPGFELGVAVPEPAPAVGFRFYSLIYIWSILFV